MINVLKYYIFQFLKKQLILQTYVLFLSFQCVFLLDYDKPNGSVLNKGKMQTDLNYKNAKLFIINSSTIKNLRQW